VSFLKDEGNEKLFSRKVQTKLPYAGKSDQRCKDLQLVFKFGTKMELHRLTASSSALYGAAQT
jgi:hypothetical protein